MLADQHRPLRQSLCVQVQLDIGEAGYRAPVLDVKHVEPGVLQAGTRPALGHRQAAEPGEGEWKRSARCQSGRRAESRRRRKAGTITTPSATRSVAIGVGTLSPGRRASARHRSGRRGRPQPHPRYRRAHIPTYRALPFGSRAGPANGVPSRVICQR